MSGIAGAFSAARSERVRAFTEAQARARTAMTEIAIFIDSGPTAATDINIVDVDRMVCVANDLERAVHITRITP